MIIFISDLHMSDNTAGPKNIPLSAFQGTFKDIQQLIVDSGAKQVKLVFLGDVFDLIRTQAWQDVLAANRPWGKQSETDTPLPASEEAANKIFDAVIKAEQNEACFGLMKSAFAGLEGVAVERIYIPGNHDRACNMYPSLREKVASILGLPQRSPDELFPYFFADAEHACFARHGQEWDAFNFDGADAFHDAGVLVPDYREYWKNPIGDVLAAEVASRLPERVQAHLPAPNSELDARLRDLFDIRPLTRMSDFLAFQIKNFADPDVTNAINKAVAELAESFGKIPFVESFIRRGLHLFAPAIELGALAELLRHVQFSSLSKIMKCLDAASDLVHGDNFRSRAAEDFARLDKRPEYRDMLYVLYGHTHQPDQEAISVLGTAPNERGRVYLNTGMWRPSHNLGLQGGFVTWKNLTYTVIYSPGEKPSDGGICRRPCYEVWSGSLQDNVSL